MSATLQQVLGGENLCGVIQGIKSGTGDDLPQDFFRVDGKCEGNTGKYFRVDGDRKTARIAQYGSPSKRRNLKGVTEIPVTLLHTIEHIIHNVTTLQNLESVNGGKQQLGREQVARDTADFKRRFIELRKACVRMAIASGQVHFDSDGNLLSSSTGAAFSIDFGVPAGNKNQLNVFGDGAIISGSWASANTGIITHIKKIKKASKKLTGYEIGCAFYGASIIDYFLANTQVTKLIANNSATQLVLQGGEIPDGFLGIKKWYPMDSSFYEDDDGTIQEIWGDDNITFTPTPSLEWFGFLEGSYPVPKTLDIVKDAAAALDNTMQVYGQFSYATLQDDPVSAKQVAGDTFLPVLKVPKAVFQAKVANF